MDHLRSVLQDIREKKNLDIYLTLLLVFLVAILSIFQVADQSIVSGAILATLALVSYSLLVNRREDKEIRRVQSSPIRSFVPRSDVNQLALLIPKSTRLWAWGTTFSSHIPLFEDDLRLAITRSNLDVRFLLVKPNCCAAKMAAFRAGDPDDRKINAFLAQNLSILDNIRKGVPKSKMDFKVIDYLGPYTIYIFDPHLERGQVHVHLSTFRGEGVLDRPTFIFTRDESKRWFDYFVEQFEKVWQQAELYESGTE